MKYSVYVLLEYLMILFRYLPVIVNVFTPLDLKKGFFCLCELFGLVSY